MRERRTRFWEWISLYPIQGRLVKMEPLMPEHKEEVRTAFDCDSTAWSVLLVNPMGAGFEEYWSANRGAPPTERLPYVIRRLSDGQVVGVSTFLQPQSTVGGDWRDIPASRCARGLHQSGDKVANAGPCLQFGCSSRTVHGRCARMSAAKPLSQSWAQSRKEYSRPRHANLDRDISVTRSFSQYSTANGQPSKSGWSNALQN